MRPFFSLGRAEVWDIIPLMPGQARRTPKGSLTGTPRPVSASCINDQTYIVFPNDLNSLNTLFGGRVMELADKVAAVVARRHAGRDCVTLGIDSVRFLAPARHGDVLVMKAAVNRVWNTSMEVGLKVFAEHGHGEPPRHIVSAYFTFVALDERGQRVTIPQVLPESEQEKRRYEEADRRRSLRFQLSTGGKSPK